MIDFDSGDNANWLRIVALDPVGREKGLIRLYQKFNPNHAPAGSPQGGQFSSGAAGDLSSIHSTMVDDVSYDSMEQYDRVLARASGLKGKELEERMAMKPEDRNMGLKIESRRFNDRTVLKRADGKLTADEVRFFRDSWAGSTWGAPGAALQEAAAARFNIPLSEQQSTYIQQAKDVFNTEDSLTVEDWGSWENLQDKAKTYVDAVYANTQEILKSEGIDHVNIFRGVAYKSAPESLAFAPSLDNRGVTTVGQGKETTITSRPLTSWSADWKLAKVFAAGGNRGYILTTSVPASQVFSLSVSGPGTRSEREYVLLGGPRNVSVFDAGY